MIMYTYEKMLAVTNRGLCPGIFLEQIRYLARLGPVGILLREKELSEADYEKLAKEALAICREEETVCILHNWPQAARRLGCPNLHLPLPKLREWAGRLKDFEMLGASVHSVQEALEARELGATYVTAGHVFCTDCKKGVPARGLSFLREVCHAVDIPVYGIGGIHEGNFHQVLDQGAAGYCLMSEAMKMGRKG